MHTMLGIDLVRTRAVSRNGPPADAISTSESFPTLFITPEPFPQIPGLWPMQPCLVSLIMSSNSLFLVSAAPRKSPQYTAFSSTRHNSLGTVVSVFGFADVLPRKWRFESTELVPLAAQLLKSVGGA